MYRSSGELLLLAFGAAWVAGIGAGSIALWRYESAPGTSGESPVTWPSGTALRRAADRPTLVAVLHPKCPCSRATLAELREIVGHSRGEADVIVLFTRPAGVPEGWERTDLWNDAATLPGTTVRADPDGLEARRFGATTSGHVALYDARGRRVFAGGITSARGHAGTSVGERAVEALLSDTRAPVATETTPIFGCPLF
jgi:hypothetical protein